MRSITAHGPRDLRVEDVAMPAAPGPGEVAVDLRVGGICGSDLHYFHHGGFGAVRLREPMILGHEVAGVISSLGEGVTDLTVGETVAVDPSRPCGACANCRRGRANLCADMRFSGSAMRFPHSQGLFRERAVVPAAQAVPVAGSAATAALCEPFAVCLHAVARAGPLLGARVLISGSGPIGCLTVLAARLAGAAEIVATDIFDPPLRIARDLGADRAVNVAAGPDGLAEERCDVVFECSGDGQAVLSALKVLKPGGRLVLVGLGGDVTLPLAAIVATEIEILGSFRFGPEFAVAADLLSRGRADASALITRTLPMEQAEDAFLLASDRARAMKVQIRLGG